MSLGLLSLDYMFKLPDKNIQDSFAVPVTSAKRDINSSAYSNYYKSFIFKLWTNEHICLNPLQDFLCYCI